MAESAVSTHEHRAGAALAPGRRLDPERLEPALLAAVDRAQQGDVSAREQVLALLEPLVRGTAGRAAAHVRHLRLGGCLDADDLLQQARVALCILVDRYDPASGPPLPFFTLRLRAIMRRYVASVRRQRPHGRHVPLHLAEAVESTEAHLERAYAEATGWTRSGGEAALYEALARLPLRTQRLLYATYWQDRSIQEAAEALCLSTTAARQARLRALADLRRSLVE
ncbi:MAG TPA: sigma-70 family RNA polymerase sigma factor, partial [Dehalococcoidia bacterium]